VPDVPAVQPAAAPATASAKKTPAFEEEKARKFLLLHNMEASCTDYFLARDCGFMSFSEDDFSGAEGDFSGVLPGARLARPQSV
jgi:hypothetical protein